MQEAEKLPKTEQKPEVSEPYVTTIKRNCTDSNTYSVSKPARTSSDVKKKKQKAGLASVEKAAVAAMLSLKTTNSDDSEEDTSVTDISHDGNDEDSITVKPLEVRRRLSLPTCGEIIATATVGQTIAV